ILVEDAFEKANEDIRTSSKLSDMNTKLLSKGLVYFPSRSKLALAWHVLVHTPPYKIAQDEEPEGRWNYFIDAITGAVLEKMNEVHTTNDQASGPGGNGERNLKTWNNELDVKYSSSQYSAKTKRFVTYDLIGGRETPQNPVSGASLVNFGNAASNNAHGYTEHVLNMLKLFGYNSINDKGFKIVSRVNYSSNYANAFWNGEMNYGDGGSHFYNLASDVGVVSHEIGHGFTAYQSNLDYIFQSGGLNESFSDIAGVTAKFYLSSLPGGIAESGANFLIGDKAVRLTAPGTLGKRGYIRNMCEPTEDGRSIDHFKNYNDTLNVHHSSGIMNKAFCLFAKRLANNSSAISGNSNPDSVMKAAEIFFYANKTQWLDYFTFHEAAEGTIQAARLLAKRLKLSSAQIELLKLSWSDVGFNVAISAPTRVSAKVVNGSVVLSWVAPTGTAPIVRNTFSYSTGWGRWSESISAGSSAATSFTIPSGILPKGAPYIFKMSTCTSSACSSWSKPSEQIKYTEAGAPFISDVEFDGGPLEGWYQLTVWGTGFGRNSKIAVGDNLCSTTVFISSREIICKPVPAASGGAGVVAVRVTNPNGKNATMPLAYLYRDIRPR
ncbi:hypothetical protein EBR03_07600, partial [bacterium]|nr:hypothetical protein [bacterium]